ncbi:MAG TPA: hypothetical protein VNE86_06835 [Nitrososphaerales archaeon]|nr:hypothetical protein [Nitrososphaerales archaeon]
MKRLDRTHRGISNLIFAGTVVVLVVVAAAGYGLYGISLTNHSSTFKTMSTTTQMTETAQNQTSAYAFASKSGAMINSAWLLAVPIGMHEYAVSVHAEGLETSATYILEGALSSGKMATMPISSQSMTMNATSASEFQSNANGTANYWIVLENNPASIFENVQLYLVPGGMMENATIVATASFPVMSSST